MLVWKCFHLLGDKLILFKSRSFCEASFRIKIDCIFSAFRKALGIVNSIWHLPHSGMEASYRTKHLNPSWKVHFYNFSHIPGWRKTLAMISPEYAPPPKLELLMVDVVLWTVWKLLLYPSKILSHCDPMHLQGGKEAILVKTPQFTPNANTGREWLIRSHSLARFCFELSGNSN